MQVDRYQGFLFNPADLSEEVDLDMDRRREVLFTAASMERWTHWELLGVRWNASAEEARNAFRDRVRVFHPDSYPGRWLGSYRGRMERIFRRLTEARDVLADDERRAAYARETAPPEEVARATVRQIEDAARAKERRERMARTNPLVVRMQRTREILERGRAAMDEERYADAARDFMTAGALDPSSAEARELAERARKRATSHRAREIWEKARAAELQSDLERAQLLAESAAEADPGEVRYRVYAARVALSRGALETAREWAEEAVRTAPRVATGHEVLGEVLLALGDDAGARKALEQAVELDGRMDGAREKLRKLRWSFLR